MNLTEHHITEPEAQEARRRHFRYLRRVILLCFALLAVMNLGLWWKGEHDSCIRSNGVREALTQRSRAATAVDHPTPGSLAAAKVPVYPLNCNTVFPASQ